MKKVISVVGIVALGLISAGLIAQSNVLPPTQQSLPSIQSAAPISFTAKDYSRLLGMQGFSDEALNLHFTLYQGYVKNTNLLLSKIQALNASSQQKTPEYAELKRRLGWEFDGMRLHELYFDNLGGKSLLSTSSPFYKKLQKSFGSYDKWKDDFVNTGLMRGIGWVILYQDPISGSLVNTWINEHDVGHFAGGQPILIMDVFEHAYLPDYKLERAKYIDAFFNNINWNIVNQRYLIVQQQSSQPEPTTPSQIQQIQKQE